MSAEKSFVLDCGNINQNLIGMEYAVRGLVPRKAAEIADEIERAKKDPTIELGYKFEEVLYCNIGNPQSVGQKPITYYRSILSLVDSPHLLENPNVYDLFPSDCVDRAKDIVKTLKVGTGAYSASQGVPAFRQNVAKFIEERDGYEADPAHIFLTNGASTGINLILTTLITQPDVGLLIPIPQYPIYSALISLFNGKQLNYYLKEEEGWSVDIEKIRETIKQSREQNIKPRAMVVINPGNPTGNVLTETQLREICKLCKEEKMVLLADEVYQENVYFGQKFVSVKKVVRDLEREIPGYKQPEFVSFHSTSKGLIGECGRRGGYMELCNFSSEVFAQILKLASSGLCGNLDGQVMTNLMVSPPKIGDISFKQFDAETKDIFNSLEKRCSIVCDMLNSIDGIYCQKSQGAMYAFPKIDLSEAAEDAARKQNISADCFYALSLLNETGICCVPGSGFGLPGHIRLTFLPQQEKLASAMEAFKAHHYAFMAKYPERSSKI